MSADGVQEGASRQTIGAVPSGGGISRTQSAIAVDRVVGLISKGRIVDAELRVVEDVENFPAQFKGLSFFDGEVPEKGNIRIESSWVAQHVSPGITKGKTSGRAESPWIQKKRAEAGTIISSLRNRAVSIAAEVRVGPRPAPICHSGIIQRADAVGTAGIDDGKRSTCLK